jgi:RNA polymerase sigma factor (sigma-70 family)
MKMNYSTNILQAQTAEPSPTTVWLAFKAGDRQAFEQLLQMFYPVLLNYGYRLAQDRAFAQDALQDFFIELWNNRQMLGSPGSVRAYLLVAFRHRLFREKGRSFWHKGATSLNEEYEVEVQLSIEHYLINHEVEHETLQRLKAELAKLTKRQREALYLRFYQALDYDQIAQAMGINHHSVVNLVYEAIRVLRKNWVLAVATAWFWPL